MSSLLESVLDSMFGVNLMLKEEIEMLYKTAKNCSGKNFVEIGNYHGASTIAIGLAIKNDPKSNLFTIDPHDYDYETHADLNDKSELFFSNLYKNKLIRKTKVIELRSQEVTPGWDKDVDFLFIDGNHSYEETMEYFEGWNPFLHSNSKLLFHDYYDDKKNPDPDIIEVKFVVDEIIKNYPFQITKKTGSLVLLEV